MIEGKIHPDFWPVARVFRSLLPKRQPGGAALCIYHRGERVIDIWAGTRDEDGNPWEPDTLSVSYSTTKGIASTLMHMLVDRGEADYDDPVCKHWPDFADGDKQRITIRQIMCHEAGLYDIRSMVDHADRMLDWDYMTRALETARPCHAPGSAHGYHGFTYGWLIGELIQRITGKSFSRVLEDELAGPLGLDGLYVGLPPEQRHRRAQLILAGIQRSKAGSDRFRGYLDRMGSVLQTMRVPFDPDQVAAALMPEGIEDVDFNSDEFQQATIPSANGMFSASSLARVYAALAAGGEIDGVRLMSRGTIETASKRQNKGIGRVIPFPMHWRLGYHRPFTMAGGIPSGFGHFGFGGSGAWADLRRNVSVALVLNSGVGTPFGDTRIVRISSAVLRCADRRASKRRFAWG